MVKVKNQDTAKNTEEKTGAGYVALLGLRQAIREIVDITYPNDLRNQICVGQINQLIDQAERLIGKRLD